MAKSSSKKGGKPRPPLITKAGVKHGANYSCGGKLKK